MNIIYWSWQFHLTFKRQIPLLGLTEGADETAAFQLYFQ